jgi:catechol 2,3-dioxygenase-like lactoylglutathione lyase family enzyme
MPTLDHVGIAAHDLDALATAYKALGFTLTPLARHAGRLTPDGPVVPFGTGNRCAMFSGGGYLELIARIDPAAPANSLDRFLARYQGIHIAAFGIDDEEAELARLRAAGFDIPGVAYLERPLDQDDPAKGIAKFARLPLPADASPEGRMQLIRHLTPQLIWRAEWTAHANRVVRLAQVIVCVEDPFGRASLFATLVGRAAARSAGDALSIELRDSEMLFVSAAGLAAMLPGVVPPSLPFIAAVRLLTDDRGRAIRSLARGREVGDAFLVPPEHAGGCALIFA